MQWWKVVRHKIRFPWSRKFCNCDRCISVWFYINGACPFAIDLTLGSRSLMLLKSSSCFARHPQADPAHLLFSLCLAGCHCPTCLFLCCSSACCSFLLVVLLSFITTNSVLPLSLGGSSSLFLFRIHFHSSLCMLALLTSVVRDHA